MAHFVCIMSRWTEWWCSHIYTKPHGHLIWQCTWLFTQTISHYRRQYFIWPHSELTKTKTKGPDTAMVPTHVYSIDKPQALLAASWL